MHHPTLTADERILAARTTLAERFAALEDRVTDTVHKAAGTVDHATSEVRGTVDDATQSVRNLFESASGQLREAFDVRKQVRAHPWEGVLLAVGAGFAAKMLSDGKAINAVIDSGLANPLGEIFARVKRELGGLGDIAVAAASKKLRENIETLRIPSLSGTSSNGSYHNNGSH